jgi:squalene-hopene/tetraprenyl-beta-curcumene cyclase
MMRIRVIVASIVSAMGILTSVALLVAGEVDWNKTKAGEYLDTRCKSWFEYQPADRGEGATRSSCICCHTIVPYALARPALRKIVGGDEATEFEKRFLAQTQMRVRAWRDLDSARYALLYDANEQKKKESWGTEAVLNALILAFDDRYQGRHAPEPTTTMAFDNLWQLQVTVGAQKGSWNWFDFGLEPWETKNARYFGAALAAIAVGSAPGYYKSATDTAVEAKVTLLRDYLKEHYRAQNLHNRLWVLWASLTLDGILTPEQRKEFTAQILAKQQDDGGWNLASLGEYRRIDGSAQEVASDGYATGLILHVLLNAGARKDDQAIAKGLDWLREHQEATGEWKACSVNKKRNPTAFTGKFMTDAATAFAVLALTH